MAIDKKTHGEEKWNSIQQKGLAFDVQWHLCELKIKKFE